MKPSKLKKYDMIGVCAPSGVIKEKHNSELIASENMLNEYDLNVVYSKNLYVNEYGYSASPESKSEDINSLIADKNIKAVVFAKGGSNTNGILDLIDYESIKHNPKFFIGFSDNTILLNAIYKKTGLVTYHFTNFKGFCESNINFNKKQFEDVFLKGYKGKVEKNGEWKSIRKGVCSGKLVGGNLSSLVKLLGTKYCPNFNNKILFIEDLSFESGVEEVSSSLYQLKFNKVFEKVSGLLIGNYDSREKYNIEDIVMDVVKEYDFPIVKCNDFGHTDTNIVLPIGLNCSLDADKCELIFNESSAK